jgi:hypothetical protein
MRLLLQSGTAIIASTDICFAPVRNYPESMSGFGEGHMKFLHGRKVFRKLRFGKRQFFTYGRILPRLIANYSKLLRVTPDDLGIDGNHHYEKFVLHYCRINRLPRFSTARANLAITK